MMAASVAPEGTATVVGMLEILKSGRFFDAGRARIYAGLMAGLTAAIAIGWIALSRHGIDPTGKPLGTDFVSFYAASKIALDGAAADAWSIARHGLEEERLFPGERDYTAFFYPPVFLLVCLPLALMPYLMALGVWLAATGAAAIAVLRRLGRGADGRARIGLAAMLGFPAVFVNAGHGQNAYLSTALFGGGVLLLDRRPILAGALLGGLVFKPHLAIVLPFALAASGRWRTFFACGASALGLVGVSALLFGLDAWRGFFATSAVARATLEQGLVEPAKMQSVFAAVRLVGGSVAAGYGLQAMVALVVILTLTRALRRAAMAGSRAGARRGETEGAATAAAALLASPFLLDYDLMLLAIPLVVLARTGLERGFRSWEIVVLLAAYILPLVSRSIGLALHMPLGPAVVLAVFVLAVGRIDPAGAGMADAPPREMRELPVR